MLSVFPMGVPVNAIRVAFGNALSRWISKLFFDAIVDDQANAGQGYYSADCREGMEWNSVLEY